MTPPVVDIQMLTHFVLIDPREYPPAPTYDAAERVQAWVREQAPMIEAERAKHEEVRSALHYTVNERDALRVALRNLIEEPYGCSLCDSGKPRNPAKGHQPDCPYEVANGLLRQVG